MSGNAIRFPEARASEPGAASPSRSNSNEAVVSELRSVHLSGYALCQNAAEDLMPLVGRLERVQGLSDEVLFLSKYSMRTLVNSAQDLFPPSSSNEDKPENYIEQSICRVYSRLLLTIFATRLLSYLVRHIKTDCDPDRDTVKLANGTITYLLQVERVLRSLLQNTFSPYKGAILEPLEDIFSAVRRRDYTILRNYLEGHGIDGEVREQLIRNIERLVIGSQRASAITTSDQPRLIRAQEMEEIRKILSGWDKDAKLYRGKLFTWLEEKLKDYIPGIMPKHLTSNRSLYNTYNKAIGRRGTPAWMLPSAPDEEEDPAVALASIRAGERERTRRYLASKRARARGPQPS